MAAIGRVLLIPKGDYSGTTVYNALDWVRDNGAAWVCKVDNTIGVAPPTLPTIQNANWHLLAADGTVSGSVNWSNVNNKPFDTVGNGLNVNASNEIELDTAYLTASNISYDNTGSGATAVDIQAAIDELFAGGGGGGSSTFAGLDDTDISSPQDNQIVQYATVSGNKKLQNVTMDASPTQNSAKPVTSGGVYTALSGKADTTDLDDWVATASVSSGTVSFSGIDDSGNYGYEVYFNITSGSTNQNPTAQLSSISGEGTSSMSLTYTTDADNGTNNAKLRRIK